MSSFEVYLDIRQPAPEAAKPSAGIGAAHMPLRWGSNRAAWRGGGGKVLLVRYSTVLCPGGGGAAVAGGSAAAALRVVHGGHEPNVVLLYRLARHSPGAQRRAARIAAAANAPQR